MAPLGGLPEGSLHDRRRRKVPSPLSSRLPVLIVSQRRRHRRRFHDRQARGQPCVRCFIGRPWLTSTQHPASSPTRTPPRCVCARRLPIGYSCPAVPPRRHSRSDPDSLSGVEHGHYFVLFTCTGSAKPKEFPCVYVRPVVDPENFVAVLASPGVLPSQAWTRGADDHSEAFEYVSTACQTARSPLNLLCSSPL